MQWSQKGGRMAAQVVISNASDKVATLAFNRPGKRNALNNEMLYQSIALLNSANRYSREDDHGED